MQYQILAVAAFAGAVAAQDACATACANAYSTCRVGADANQATCASSYASCLGYSPFDGTGSLVTPTACSITTSATASSYTGICNAAATQRGDCTLNIATPTPSVYAGICNAAAIARGDCTATAASVPTAYSNVTYTTITTNIYTTFCPVATTVVQNGKTYTATASQTLTITDCPCTITSPVGGSPATSAPAAAATTGSGSGSGTSACAASCSATYDTCRVGTPGNSGNQSACYAAYANCLGFIPTNAAGTFTTPTACAASGTGAGAGAATATVKTGSVQYTGAASVEKAGGALMAMGLVAALL